jgi:hypothetical protein
MDISNRHNLATRQPATGDLRFGIRVTLPAADPFARLLGRDWQREHWYASARERDEALREMGKRHAFNRGTDRPSIVLEAIRR